MPNRMKGSMELSLSCQGETHGTEAADGLVQDLSSPSAEIELFYVLMNISRGRDRQCAGEKLKNMDKHSISHRHKLSKKCQGNDSFMGFIYASRKLIAKQFPFIHLH